MVRTRNRVRGQQRNDLIRGKSSSIREPRNDRIHRVLWLRDKPVGSRSGGIRSASEELEFRCTGAVGDGDGTGELDQVACGDLGVVGEEREEGVDAVGYTEVGEKVGFDVGEDEHGSVGTSSSGLALALEGLGECNSVVWTV